jgi:hypothetical protein
MKHQILPTVGVILGVSAAGLQAQTLISDNFETDTSANYTVVEGGGPDGSSTFAFDYIAAGLPLAPNSTAGDRGGLRLTANDTLGASDALTAYHTTAIGVPNYILSVDIYMGVTGTGGTTEYANVGVAGDGVTPNSIFTPISAGGPFMAMTGEGGSSSDFRWNDGVNPVNSGDVSYSSGGSVNASDPYYQAIYPSPPFQFLGSPGNSWTTMEIRVNGSNIGIFLDGTVVVDGIAAALPGNQVSLGIADVFSSVANPFQSQFVVYDNLSVVVPEPTTGALMLLGGLGLFLRARRRS